MINSDRLTLENIMKAPAQKGDSIQLSAPLLICMRCQKSFSLLKDGGKRRGSSSLGWCRVHIPVAKPIEGVA